MFRLILFDIDGTLVRTGGAGMKAFESVFEEVFGYPTGIDNIHFAGRTDKSLIREMLINHDIEPSEENFTKFIQAYPQWLTHWLDELDGHVCEGVNQFVSQCVDRRSPPVVGLLTGNLQLGAKMKLEYYGLWERFEFGAFGDDSEDRNELAFIAWQRGKERVGNSLRADEILVVGDTPRDIECARSIGARVLAVTTGGATRDELNRLEPDWLVDSMGEVQW